MIAWVFASIRTRLLILLTVFSTAAILFPSGDKDAARYRDFRASLITLPLLISISLITEYSLFSHRGSAYVSTHTSLLFAYDINIGYICPGVCILFSVFFAGLISTNDAGRDNDVFIAIILSLPAYTGE